MGPSGPIPPSTGLHVAVKPGGVSTAAGAPITVRFTLKDESSQIRAVLFRPQLRHLRFTPEEVAFRTLQKAAMDHNRKLLDVAEATLALPDIVFSQGRTPPQP